MVLTKPLGAENALILPVSVLHADFNFLGTRASFGTHLSFKNNPLYIIPHRILSSCLHVHLCAAGVKLSATKRNLLCKFFCGTSSFVIGTYGLKALQQSFSGLTI